MALDALPGTVSTTLALLTVMAQDLTRRKEKKPKQTFQKRHQLQRQPLNHVAERLGISFPVPLYNISPFWLPNFVQAENNPNEQQVRLYVEAMERV